MNIKPEERFYYLSNAKYWNLYETYLLVGSQFIGLKLRTVITRNDQVVATDLEGVKAYDKARADLLALFMDAVARKKLKCTNRQRGLLESEFNMTSDLYVERKSFLQWYKSNKKILRRVLPEGEFEDFVWTENEALFDRISKSLNGNRHQAGAENIDKARNIAKKAWKKDKALSIEAVIRNSLLNVVTKDDEEKYSNQTFRRWIKDLAPSNEPGRKPEKK
jgi:hypothetical protein